MEAPEIIKNFLKENGYDGLFNLEGDFCCCTIEEGIAGECGAILADCCAGHAIGVNDRWEWQDGPRRGADIKSTLIHDAGAYGHCSHCGRYSDNPKILSHEIKCECGLKTGWCGSFKKPKADSDWSTDK